MAQIPLATQEDLEAITPASLGVIESVVAGANVTVNNTDPRHPVISTTGGGGGGGLVNEVAAGIGVTVDPTDPTTPVIAVDFDVFAPVATSGEYADLSGTPTLGTAAAADASAFVPTARTVSAGTGLTGGGDLSANRTVGLSAEAQASLELADTAVQPDALDALDTTYWHVYTDVDEARVGSGKVEVWVASPPSLGEPDNAELGDVTLRVTPGVGQVFVLAGGDYVAAGGRTFVGATEPSGVDPVNGDQWIDPAGGVHYIWWDTEWLVVGGDAPEPTAPGKVTGLSATAGNGTVTLAWSVPSTGGSAITDYVIERAPDDEGVPGSWETLTDGTSTSTGYVDDDVTNGLTYWYRVSAVNTVGTGDPSDPEDATPTGPPPPAGPFLVAYDPMPFSATASPVVTLDEYDPVENDIVFAFIGSTTTATVTVPSGWASVIGSPYIVVPGDTTLVGLCVYHVVTDTEELAETNSWTLTNVFNTTEIGEIIAVVVRGADPADVVDAFNVSFNESTSMNHTLPSLEGDDLSNDSLVLALVLADGMQTYDSAPAGWTSVSPTTGTNMGGHLYQLDAYTETGVDITAATVVASSADETVGLTVAILVAP